MLTAKEAKEIAVGVDNVAIKDFMIWVNSAIENAARGGHLSLIIKQWGVSGFKCLTSSQEVTVKKRLELAGYEIKYNGGDQRDNTPGYYTISWGK
jgi:hypothetical protein